MIETDVFAGGPSEVAVVQHDKVVATLPGKVEGDVLACDRGLDLRASHGKGRPIGLLLRGVVY